MTSETGFELDFPYVRVQRIVHSRDERRIKDFIFASWNSAQKAIEADAPEKPKWYREVIAGEHRRYRSDRLPHPDGKLQYIIEDAG